MGGQLLALQSTILLHISTIELTGPGPARPPAESHQPLLTASAPQNSIEETKSSTHNENTNSGKDHNSTHTILYPHSELKGELSRAHCSIQV